MFNFTTHFRHPAFISLLGSLDTKLVVHWLAPFARTSYFAAYHFWLSFLFHYTMTSRLLLPCGVTIFLVYRCSLLVCSFLMNHYVKELSVGPLWSFHYLISVHFKTYGIAHLEGPCSQHSPWVLTTISSVGLRCLIQECCSDLPKMVHYVFRVYGSLAETDWYNLHQALEFNHTKTTSAAGSQSAKISSALICFFHLLPAPLVFGHQTILPSPCMAALIISISYPLRYILCFTFARINPKTFAG